MTDDRTRRLIVARDRERRLAACAPPVREQATDREVLLVVGGSPAALELAHLLDDPEFREVMRQRIEAFAEQLGATMEAAARCLADTAAAYGTALADVHRSLVDAGVLPEPPPEDPRERALWLRQHRGTGPDRQVQHRPGPRSLR